jgi:hypothetical protein
MAGASSIEPTRFNRIPSFAPECKGMMADSAFWQDLAAQFLALQDTGRLRAGEANDFMYVALETLAKRGASKIASADAPDLLAIWVEALRKEGFPSTLRTNLTKF